MSDNDTILELYYGYIPNIPLAVITLVLYFLISFPLFWQSYSYHNRLMYVLPFTALVECFGYILRVYMIENASLNVYILTGLLIILAPNALAFANYKVLGKIIHTKSVHHRVHTSIGVSSAHHQAPQKISFRIPYLMNESGEVHGNRLASFFFISDIVAILLQGSGGGLQGSGNADLGTDILLFGLVSQILFFAVYTGLAIYVYVSPLYQEYIPEAAANSVGVMEGFRENKLDNLTRAEYDRAFFGLFTTIGLLFIRNIYRVIEFTMGYQGYLATTEVFMYLFDTLLIFIAFILYIKYNFAAFLAKADKQVQREENIAHSVYRDGSSLHSDVDASRKVTDEMSENGSTKV